MAQFIKTIQNFAFQNNLWSKNSKIVIGVSGGPDSACLLDVLSKLAPKYNLSLNIAHVNYGLRGEDSVKDEIFVKNLAKKYGIPVKVLLVKKHSNKGNLENNLRKIRYDFFEKLRDELGFELIAVAHNQDDQAETVLMRIIRGSGLNGLSSMKAANNGIIRPLLRVNKKDILAYLKENKLKYRIDKSNKSLKFTRNKIRNRLIPYLEKNFNPVMKKTLSEWSLLVADDYAYIDSKSEFFRGIVCKSNRVVFSASKFQTLHISIQRQEIISLFGILKGNSLDLESRQVNEVIKVIKSVKSKTQNANIGGLKILKKGDSIEIFC